MKLVCTDLDRTLLPNGEQEESTHARPIFKHLLRTHDVRLAYVSGRDVERVLDAIEEYELRIPDVIVADVGSSIYVPASGRWEKSAQWDALVSSDWGGASSRDIKIFLQHFDYLQEQEDDRQSVFKRSFYYPESADEQVLREAIDAALVSNNVHAALVFSHDPEKHRGLLDVLPKSATKRDAVAFLQSLFELLTEDVLFAGDSGNDVSAICSANPGVLVANADDDTRDAVLTRVEAAVDSSGVCFARGQLAVAGYEELNGNYSAGIVEGLMHFRPEWKEHLNDAHWLKQAMEYDIADESGRSFGMGHT